METRTIIEIGAVVAIIACIAGLTTGGCKTAQTYKTPSPLPNYAEMSDQDLRERAVAENHDAEYELGRRAYVHRNAEAAQWFCRAADAGHPNARYMVGLLYEPGQAVGVTNPSYSRAYMWLSLAAAGGAVDALREKERLFDLLTPEQIAEARRLITNWKPGSCGV